MFGIGTLPDLLRLAVLPVLAWTAVRDVRTRRVPNIVWYPLAALGIALLAWELLGHFPPETVFDRLYLIRVGVSVCLVVPLSYLFWRLGGFGGADAKALMVFAVLLPTFPSYTLAGTEFPSPSGPRGTSGASSRRDCPRRSTSGRSRFRPATTNSRATPSPRSPSR